SRPCDGPHRLHSEGPRRTKCRRRASWTLGVAVEVMIDVARGVGGEVFDDSDKRLKAIVERLNFRLTPSSPWTARARLGDPFRRWARSPGLFSALDRAELNLRAL